MKKTLKLMTVAVLTCVLLAGLSACGKKEVSIKAADITISSYTGNVRTAVPSNKISMDGDVIVIDLETAVDEVEFELYHFFNKNANHKKILGKDFRFTRNDVTTKTGYGLEVVTYVPGTSNHLWRKYGETGAGELKSTAAMQGILRMYDFTKAGFNSIVLYADAAATSNLAANTTYNITYTFTGHNKQKATLKVRIHNALEA